MCWMAAALSLLKQGRTLKQSMAVSGFLPLAQKRRLPRRTPKCELLMANGHNFSVWCLWPIGMRLKTIPATTSVTNPAGAAHMKLIPLVPVISSQ